MHLMPPVAERERLIQAYLKAYNAMQVEGMLRHLSSGVVFIHRQGSQVQMTLEGKEAFKAQANAVLPFFKQRQITISAWRHLPEKTETDILFEAILANMPEAKARISLRGVSEFQFAVDGTICAITDIQEA